MTPEVRLASGSSGSSVTLIALVDGASQLHAATLVHRDQALLHISTLEPLPLTVGSVVGVMTHGGETTEVSLALVSDSVGPAVTELRMIGARRAGPG